MSAHLILLVARREILGHLRSTRLRALFVLVVTLLATGTFVNAQRFDARVRYADALESLRAVSVALDAGDPESVASRFGWRSGRVVSDPALRAVRAPTPASFFALGADLVAPGYWQFGTEGLVAGPSQEADAFGRSQDATLDVEFVVRAVLSLVAILLGADMIAGDRERGLLRALFAAPVSRLDVVLGKYLGALTALCVPLGTGGAAAAVAAWVAHAPLTGTGLGPRVALLALGSVAYLSAMLALGAAVSARSRDAQTAVVASVAVWALLVVVLPGAASLAASVARPVMPAELHHQSRIDGIRQLESERARALATVWRRVAGTDEVPHDSMISPALRRAYDMARAPVEAGLMRRKRALLRGSATERSRQRRAQARLAERIELLSPPSAFARYATTVVGTGAPAMERWTYAAEEAQGRLEGASFDRVYGTELFAARDGYLRVTYMPNAFSATERVPRYDELPPFARPSPDLGADVRVALPALTVLLVDALACLGLAARTVLRMEV